MSARAPTPSEETSLLSPAFCAITGITMPRLAMTGDGPLARRQPRAAADCNFHRTSRGGRGGRPGSCNLQASVPASRQAASKQHASSSSRSDSGRESRGGKARERPQTRASHHAHDHRSARSRSRSRSRQYGHNQAVVANTIGTQTQSKHNTWCGTTAITTHDEDVGRESSASSPAVGADL